MTEEIDKTIYNLALHEEIIVYQNSYIETYVLRVPGGWVYTSIR